MMKKPTVVIFLTVFIYLLGFGMILPILPLISTHFGASAFQAGLLMSTYSLMQFIFAPFWGKLSDKYGRRPILMYCLLGEAISYLILAWSKSLEMVFFARLMTGFFAASISTASAYMSDITSKEERSKGMALIGAAFGLGFLFGPAIGGLLTILASQITPGESFAISFSSYGVALLCLITFVFAFFNLKESLSAENRSQNTAVKTNRIQNIFKFLRMPTVGILICTFALATLAMSIMEATLVLFMNANFNWGLKEVSFGFAYVGICIVLTQGFLVRKLIPKFGERNILRMGLIFMTIGLCTVAFADKLWLMGIAMTFLSVGNGFVNPALLGSVSLSVPADEQGIAMGTTQSLSSLARVIGPAMGGALFTALTPGSPFLSAGSLTLVALLLVISIFTQLPTSGRILKAENKDEPSSLNPQEKSAHV